MEPLRVLVVDDDLALATLVQRYLERLGCEVELADDSQDALRRFQSARRPFKLVVADMSMPGLSGEELLGSVLERDHHVRAILTSGYAMAETTLEQQYHGRIEFLQKPFFPKMLADTVSKLFP